MTSSGAGPERVPVAPVGPPADLSRVEWWATLEPSALADETRFNRRRECWVLVAAGLSLVLTVVVLVLQGAPP